MDLFNDNFFNPNSLYKKISDLDSWIHDKRGLNMREIIFEIFEEWGYLSNLPIELKIKFEEGLYFLRQTNMKESYIRKKLMNMCDKIVVDSDGKYMLVNKLNTNYKDLSELLVELIKRGCEANPDKGLKVYDDIMRNPMEGLLKLKPYLKKLLEHYFIINGEGIDDFSKFTSNIKKSTEIGDKSEEHVKLYLESMGFEVLYQGGNGDHIDMVFGCDMIVYREDYGYKSIQVKTKYKSWESLKHYYEIDWVAFRYPKIEIYELVSRNEIKISFITEKLKIKNKWLKYYKNI